MLKLSPFCLAAVLCLQLPICAAQTASITQQIDAAVAPFYKADAPGAVVLVTKDGKVLLRKGYGMADVAAKLPLHPDASLRIGSVTKQFTAVAILLLMEEGKLSLSDPVTRFFPDYPAAGQTVTIAHLLAHSSGLVNYTSKKDFMAHVAQETTVPHMMALFQHDPLEFTPGARHAYSNSGYVLLGAIIEKLSGQPYGKFLEQRIFVPLGMTQTAYEGMERGPTLRATGHTKKEQGFTVSDKMSISQAYAAGGLVSSVDDLARWDAAITAGKLLSKESWKRAHTAYTFNDGKRSGYGFGWEVVTVRGSPALTHGGSIAGYISHVVRLPQEKVFVTVLANADSGLTATGIVARRAAAVAIGKPYPAYKVVTLPAAALDALGGVYKLNDKVNRSVRREQGNLVLERKGRDPVTLHPYGENAFFVTDANYTVKFGRSDKGQVDRMIVVEEEQETVNARVLETGAAAAAPASGT
jgi:D-alanyl-D-alanine carboxypeptidase